MNWRKRARPFSSPRIRQSEERRLPCSRHNDRDTKSKAQLKIRMAIGSSAMMSTIVVARVENSLGMGARLFMIRPQLTNACAVI